MRNDSMVIAVQARPEAVVDCSTIDINDACEAYTLAAKACLAFLVAPVSGGISGAADGAKQATALGAHALLLYTSYVEAGGGAEDFSGIIRYLDTLPRKI